MAHTNYKFILLRYTNIPYLFLINFVNTLIRKKLLVSICIDLFDSEIHTDKDLALH